LAQVMYEIVTSHATGLSFNIRLQDLIIWSLQYMYTKHFCTFSYTVMYFGK
jgi:hypothetical protein